MQRSTKSLIPEARLPATRTLLQALLPPIALIVVLVLLAQYSYLLFHFVAELFSVVIAITAMVVASTARQFTRNHFMVFVAIAIGWCSMLDVVHMLSYPGMQILSPDDDMAVQLWIAARFIQAAALLASPLFLQRSFRSDYGHLGFALVVAAAGGWVFSGTFPEAFVYGQGLTPFKIYSEYLIIAMLIGAAILLWRKRRLMSPPMLVALLAAVSAMILSEFAFTRYVNVFGVANEIGHVLKIFAYWFVYLALVERTLIEPFSMMARTSSTFDAVPDPTFVTGLDGRVRQANDSGIRASGLSVEDLHDQPIHHLFHAPEVGAENCPVCARVAAGEHGFSTIIDRGAGKGFVECSVAPFSLPGERRRNVVQMVRDVTQTKMLEMERERLLRDLGERVKELRCQYQVSEILQRNQNDLAQILREVVAVLPPGFLMPERARACFVGSLGFFGDAGVEQARQVLSVTLACNGEQLGSLQVFYPAEAGIPDDPFLAEEREMMTTIGQRLGAAIERIQASQQVRRLTYLQDMLSMINRAIVRCESYDELLLRTYEALSQHGAFPKLFIARMQQGRLPMSVEHVHGFDIDRIDQLKTILSDPEGPVGYLLDEIAAGKVVWTAPFAPGRYTGWMDYLRDSGITERALVPLRHDNQLFGVIGLYSQGDGKFDEAQVKLLEDMAHDLEFALTAIFANERSRVAQQRADISDLRFHELFDASPSPMQILSVSQGRFLALNRAFSHWLGYSMQDIPTMDDWFDQAYAGPQVREMLRARWSVDVETARSRGEAVRSPELLLRGKDGQDHVAIGSMTIVGDDAIVAWTDLTELKRNEEALRRSERHFRSMIEDTVLGIYVRRGDRFIYVNPRYSEIVGWSVSELVGQPIWKFTPATQSNVESIKQAWEKLAQGQSSVHYDVPLICRNGEVKELALHASHIDWDGEPATIVVAEDITERRLAERKIADYVKRLEASMEGTLHVVSRMVDLRDPYTSGHERRVGLIAAAIAREMGWDDARCSSLELIGLVHDIGKIAVPAEILSKPGRLSPVEMELVRGHVQAGYDILKDVPFSFPVAEIIYQHHERLDGTGYPRKLKGEQILPEARILSVADVLESMAAHRPYRPALGMDVALTELQRGRGAIYDADVVDAVTRMVRDKGYTLPQ